MTYHIQKWEYPEPIILKSFKKFPSNILLFINMCIKTNSQIWNETEFEFIIEYTLH